MRIHGLSLHIPRGAGPHQCPTIVNNVETLCDVKHIVAMGGKEFSNIELLAIGTRTQVFLGHVMKPGYYESDCAAVTLAN